MTSSLVFGLFLEAFAIASQLIQALLMKEFLKVLTKKGIYEKMKEINPDISDSLLTEMGIKKQTFPYGWGISIILTPFLVCLFLFCLYSFSFFYLFIYLFYLEWFF
jgi:hypothetical protein